MLMGQDGFTRSGDALRERGLSGAPRGTPFPALGNKCVIQCEIKSVPIPFLA